MKVRASHLTAESNVYLCFRTVFAALNIVASGQSEESEFTHRSERLDWTKYVKIDVYEGKAPSLISEASTGIWFWKRVFFFFIYIYIFF